MFRFPCFVQPTPSGLLLPSARRALHSLRRRQRCWFCIPNCGRVRFRACHYEPPSLCSRRDRDRPTRPILPVPVYLRTAAGYHALSRLWRRAPWHTNTTAFRSGCGYLGAWKFGLHALTGFLLLMGTPTSAQEAPHGQEHLNVDRLVEQVLADNAGLKALRAAVEAAEARVVPAGALPDPQVAIDVAPETIGGFGAPPGVDGDTRISWSIRQSFPWPGTLGLRAEAARKEAAAATKNTAALRLRLAAAAKSTYAEWRYLHRALEINTNNQALVDELRRVAEQRYAAGLARQRDVLQAEVEWQRLKHQAIQLRRLKRAVQAKINALLNRPAAEPLAEPTVLPQPQDLPAYQTLRDRALASHPELAQIQRRIAANEDRELLARKDFFPDFTAFGGSRGVMDPAEKRLYVGIGISLPLGRDKYRARLNEAKADTRRLEFEFADRRAQLLSRLEQAHAAAEEARLSIALYESELVPLARENLSAARAEYGAGGGAFLDVIDAERNKLDAELNLARVRADYFAAIAELERWTAGELPGAPAPDPVNTLESSYE